MKAVVFYGKGNMKIKDIAIPKIKNKEVLIKIKAASICGTDVNIFRGLLEVETPLVLGHDFCGVIERVGKNVKIPTGEKVVIEPIRYCGVCHYCKTKRYNLCDSAEYMGFETNGGFEEYIVVPAKCTHKIPKGVSFDEAAVTEPIVVALHTMDFIKTKKDKTVAIIGQGPIGLVETQIAKLNNMKVIAIDLHDERLRLSKQFGADHIINSNKSNIKNLTFKLTKGTGVDYAIECVGTQNTIDLAYEITRKGGEVIVVGEAKNLRGPPLAESKEIKVQDVVFMGYKQYQKALNLIKNKKVKVKELITHKCSLYDLPSIIDAISKKNLDAIRVVVKV